MKVLDKRLEELINIFVVPFCHNIASKQGLHNVLDVQDCLKELQSYRKVYGVLSADDLLNSATAFEELKHAVEEAIKEIQGEVGKQNDAAGAGLCRALNIIIRHVSEYLED